MHNNGPDNDLAFAIATEIVEIFAPCLRPEERREALAEVLDRVMAGLARFAMEHAAARNRFHPSQN